MATQRTLRSLAAEWWASVCALTTDRFALVGRLTLILLVIHSHETWYTKSPIIICSILGLTFKRALMEPALWLVISSLLNAANFFNWSLVDNHKFLMGYWCIGMFLCCERPRRERDQLLKLCGRSLIGLSMAFSVLSKATSPSFMNSSFFQYSLLTDERFTGIASRFGGVSPPVLSNNRSEVEQLRTGSDSQPSASKVHLESGDRIPLLARALTVWTLSIEAALAIAFLIPSRPKWDFAGGMLLIVFALSTYSVATVQGFGWLLLIMTIAQSTQPRLAASCIVAILVLQIYMMPIADFLNHLFKISSNLVN